VVAKRQCPTCRENGRDTNQDNLVVYSDGHTYCFACQETSNQKYITDFSYQSLPDRKISKETCEKYRYAVTDNGIHICFFLNDAIKYRSPEKAFWFNGNNGQLPLWGIEHCTDLNRFIIITEGEIDALSVAEAAPTLQVCSLPNGCSSAVKTIEQNKEVLEKFKYVVLLFDNDEPGQKAALLCSSIITSARNVILPLKDANEMLVAGRSAELLDLIYNTKESVPEGLIIGAEMSLDELKTPMPRGYKIKYRKLDSLLRGYSKGRLHTVTAGTGTGKTTFCKEIMHDLIVNHGLKVGGVFLEETVQEAALSLIALDNNIPIKDLRENPRVLSNDLFQRSKEHIVNKAVFNQGFDTGSSAILIQTMRLMVSRYKCDFIIFDNLSFTVGASAVEDERRGIDKMMTVLRHVCHKSGVGIILVVQMTKTFQNISEEGWELINLSQLRGSGSIAHQSDTVISLEKNIHSANKRRLVVLKNRVGGTVGVADELLYIEQTGRLLNT